MNIENGFKVFHTIFFTSFFIKKGVENKMKSFGLSEAEARFLFFIGLGNGERKIHELIEFSGKHKSTVRQKLLLLEEDKLIKIEPCKKDKRERKVSFTQKGKKLFQKILKVNTDYQQKIFKNFNQEEVKTLLHLLEKLNIN